MRKELRALLLATDAITALTGQRIDWGQRPSGDKGPAIVLRMVQGTPDYDMDGASGLVDGFAIAECWGSSYGDAARVRDAVRAAVSGTRGGIFQAILIEGERDGSEFVAPDNLFCISLDLRVWHTTA